MTLKVLFQSHLSCFPANFKQLSMTFNKFVAYLSILTLVHINSMDLQEMKKP